MGSSWWRGFSTSRPRSQHSVRAAEERQVFTKMSCVHSLTRMFFGGHRFIMLERIEQETWKTLEESQHSLGLECGCCPELVPTGIFFFFAQRSFIKWSETKLVKFGYGCFFRVWGFTLLFGKKEIHCYSSTISPDLFGNRQIDLIKQW